LGVITALGIGSKDDLNWQVSMGKYSKVAVLKGRAKRE
jgi:hypothetical protein